MMTAGVSTAWGQEPVEITEDTNGNGVIDDSEKKLYLIQTYAFQSFYIVPQDDNKITTNNILGDYMPWYFLDAGKVGEVQYYYIVNNSTGKYVYNSNGNGRSIDLKSSTEFASLSDTDKEKCKFKFVLDESNGTTGFYNIDVKASQTYFGLNKQGGSEPNTNPIRLTNNQYIHDPNSKWKFIHYNGTFTWPAPPFELSTDIEHYYKIRNVQSNTFYVSTDATPDKVTYSNTESNSMVWYFKEAPNDPSTPWFKYYYIVNPKADNKYMYYSGTVTDGSNQADAVRVETYDSNDENRFQFVVIQAARGDGNGRVTCYAIIPKLLRENYWTSNSIGSTSINNGTNMGIISSRSTPNSNNTLICNAHWQFVTTSYPLKCVAPTITYSSTTGKITIASTTSGNTIHYTTDGTTEPTSSVGTPYSGPFDVSGPITIKAIATKDGFDDSDVTTESFSQVATPSIQDNGSNAISITTETIGAKIYYTTNGSTPTTSSTEYTGPLTGNVSGVTIKAIAVKDGMINSTVKSGSVTLKCAKPVIAKSGDNVTISCNFPASGVSIHYTKNGGDPTSSSTLYSGAISVSLGDVIKAVAIASGYDDSEIAIKTIRTDLTPTDGKYLINNSTDFDIFVDMANEEDGAGYHYVLNTNVNASTIAAITQPFSGTFDGNFYKISGLKHPLFNTINGGTVKNVILENVNIPTGTNVGAIANEVEGTYTPADGESPAVDHIARIYNCGVLSGAVIGSGNVGGLVGLIKSNSSVRVVNCYNFATVSGGSTMAGVVGNNEGTVGNVRIAMCMMYGEMAGTSPVYAGNHVSNSKNFTEYNFWRYRSGLTYTTGNYNDQLAIDKDEYLTRFPFYRHILNTHRELAAYFLFANNTTEGNVSDITQEQVDEIGHWVLDKEKADYPIIEPWVKNRKSTPTQTNNNLPNTTADYAGKLLTTMGNMGYLSVSIKIGDHSYSESLPITDMDTLRYDYTYGKVILPFANEYEINTDYSKICTGWKITKVGSSTSSSVTNYNFADRDNLQKDIYNESTNPFIYAQGGYYIVPTDVSSIEITANFATAYYLSDATYEIGYNSSYGERTGKGGNVLAFHNQPLHNTLTAAVDALAITTDNPHKQAIVLVGNYHYDLASNALATTKAFTLMSIDADSNQEPDYGFYSIGPERPQMPALRFDFLPIISLGMAAKVNGSNYYPGVPIWKSRGWYEQTETTISIMNQFELDSGNFNIDETAVSNKGNGQNPCIINGGYFVQMIRSNKTDCKKVSYFKIGGNAYIKEFYPGAHSGNTAKTTTTIVPVNVTGGQVDECFMTGYRSGGKAIGSDIRFWCSGGKIGKFLGAYMDKPLENSNSTNQNPGTVNMTAQVDHALIGRFFGGGTSQNATITGDINVTINNSKVDFYCGGPEFGDMSSGKEVVTNANNTKFGEYYGAGFGGTSITYSPKDGNPNIGADVPFTGYTFNTNRLTSSGSLGLATCYKFEYFMHSFDKNKLVARFITGYANFSLATTGNVTNNLTECTVEKDFYGAGCQGMVDGTVNSTLTDCTIKGSAFGGGYKAESNEVEVYPAGAPTLSRYNGETGIFSEFGKKTPIIFTWEQGDASNQNTAVDCDSNGQGGKLYTSKDITMADLGNVTGNITLTIEGESTIGSTTTGGVLVQDTGNVYGGGNESKSLANTTVNLRGNTEVLGNVFGGGNEAAVEGSATVNIMVPETNNNNNNNGGNNNGGGN